MKFRIYIQSQVGKFYIFQVFFRIILDTWWQIIIQTEFVGKISRNSLTDEASGMHSWTSKARDWLDETSGDTRRCSRFLVVTHLCLLVNWVSWPIGIDALSQQTVSNAGCHCRFRWVNLALKIMKGFSERLWSSQMKIIPIW